MKKFRLICLLLALMLSLGALAACKTDEKSPETTATDPQDTTPTQNSGGPEEVVINYKDYLPEATFDYADFNVLVLDSHLDKYEVEEAEDTFSEALLLRNQYLEERYQVVFSFVKAAGGDEFHNKCSSALMAGTSPYDVVLTDYYYGLETAGYFRNLNDFDVFKFENPYWIGMWNENATVNDILYSAAGYSSLDVINLVEVVFCNDYIVKQSNLGDLGSVVKAGDWTLEKMLEYMEVATVENGDGTRDFRDQYGLSYNLWSGRALLYCAGMRLTEYKDGEISFNVTSEENYNVFSKVESFLLKNNYCYYGGGSGPVDGPESDINLFLNSRSLFNLNRLEFAPQVADVFKEYSVYPFPKYDNSQKEYMSTVLGHLVMGIMRNAANPEMSATVMEAMNILTYEDVRPIYYEDMMKLRYSSDAETAEMLDLITESVSVEFAFINSSAFASIANYPFDLIDPHNQNVTGGYYSFMGQFETKLDGYLANFLTFYSDQYA